MPTCGLYYTRDSEAVTMKVATGVLMLDKFREKGLELLEVLGEGWAKHSRGFLRSDFQDYVEYTLDTLFTFVRPYYEEHYTGKDKCMGQTAVHRSRFNFLKSEIVRFRRPPWNNHYGAIYKAIHSNKPFELKDLFRIQEEVILGDFEGHSGVYVLSHFENPHEIYVGEAEDGAKRNRGANNRGFYFVRRGYLTLDKSVARQLESSIHDKLRKHPSCKGERAEKGAGAFLLEKGVDGVSLVDTLVREHYRRFCSKWLGERR